MFLVLNFVNAVKFLLDLLLHNFQRYTTERLTLPMANCRHEVTLLVLAEPEVVRGTTFWSHYSYEM